MPRLSPSSPQTHSASSSLGPQKHLDHILCDDSLFAQGRKSVSFALDAGQMHVDQMNSSFGFPRRSDRKKKKPKALPTPATLESCFPNTSDPSLVRELGPGGAQALIELGQRREGPRAQHRDSRACFSFLASDLGVSPGIYSSPRASCWPELSRCRL